MRDAAARRHTPCLQRFETVDAAAAAKGFDVVALKEALTVHNEHYDRGVKGEDVRDETGKRAFPTLYEFDEPIYGEHARCCGVERQKVCSCA